MSHSFQYNPVRSLLDSIDVLMVGGGEIFLEAILQIASLIKCPDTTHLSLPMTSSAPELVPLITVLPPSRVPVTAHTFKLTSRSNRVYKDNHFFLLFDVHKYINVQSVAY